MNMGIALGRTCSRCGCKRLKSEYTSERARLCNACKMAGKRCYAYKSDVYNRGTASLKGNNGLVAFHYKNGASQLLAVKRTKAYVREGRARMAGRDAIVELYSESELYDYIRERENSLCQLCGNPGILAALITPKERGGKKTPFNMHYVCKECHKALGYSYLHKAAESSFPGTHKRKYRSGYRTLTVYCDASVYEPLLHGVGIVLVENDKATAQAELFHVDKPANSVFGELLAIRYALHVLVGENMRQVVGRQKLVKILTDISYIDTLIRGGGEHPSFREMVRKIKDLMMLAAIRYPRTVFSVTYIGRERNSYYHLAHHTARSWIRREHSRASMPIDQIL
ncbi:HNH endonuclease [Paenibacillus mesophilus]|uniref:HNH endonuclease n=1 Tax=Paenibacillus mesophilus TaxID=2582849 RepID=UPI00110ED8D4|nr:HNH endonuclease [Paenibacillus mesophilus]TMV49575.1 HNH endonuclease [Paenibacillus mesophilus]